MIWPTHSTYLILLFFQLLYKLSSGFERESVEHLVNYAYTGRLEVPDSLVRAVFIAARRLKVSEAAKPQLKPLHSYILSSYLFFLQL